MSKILSLGYIPYSPGAPGVEATWLADALGCGVDRLEGCETLNLHHHADLPDPARVRAAVEPLVAHEWIVAEGPGAFLWTAALRAAGFRGAVTILPYLNPTTWFDVSALAVYRRFADPRDRVFVGSTPSSGIYRGLGIDAQAGEPFGIDDDVFRPRADSRGVLDALGVAEGPVILFAGRAEPDKDLHRLLGVALKARLLFPDLQVLIATHVVDRAYMSAFERVFAAERGLHLIVDPSRDELARLYSAADVFVTASTSHFETFGRAPAEALACGTRAIAPRYDGFAEVLAQPGGRLVDVEMESGVPRVSDALLLRAIYEELSSTDTLSAETISAAARGRFARSRSLQLLAYLAEPPPLAVTPPPRVASVEVAIPVLWRAVIDELERMPPDRALEHIWARDEHAPLSAFDATFQTAVRVSLAEAARSSASHRDLDRSCL